MRRVFDCALLYSWLSFLGSHPPTPEPGARVHLRWLRNLSVRCARRKVCGSLCMRAHSKPHVFCAPAMKPCDFSSTEAPIFLHGNNGHLITNVQPGFWSSLWFLKSWDRFVFGVFDEFATSRPSSYSSIDSRPKLGESVYAFCVWVTWSKLEKMLNGIFAVPFGGDGEGGYHPLESHKKCRLEVKV